MSSDASDGTKTRELHNAICEYLDSLTLETADPKAKHLLLKLHELDCGPYFDNDIAIKAVAHMENVDGTTGPHWTFAEVEEMEKTLNSMKEEKDHESVPVNRHAAAGTKSRRNDPADGGN